MNENHHQDAPSEDSAPRHDAAPTSVPVSAPASAPSTGWSAAPTATVDEPAPAPSAAGPYTAGPYATGPSAAGPYATGQQPTQQYGVPDQYGAHDQYGNQPYRAEQSGWYGQGTNPVGPTAWYGGAATSGGRAGKPRQPWFWPVIAIAVGVAALLAGGGAGFAIGHAIGSHQSQSSTTTVPGQGSNGFPGGTGGGTNQFPGQQGGTGTDGSSDSGGSTNGSSSNS